MPLNCVVVGGGLAGASAAFSLARRGWQVQVLDRAPAPAAGASGLPVGLLAPHVSADDRALSRLTRAGVAMTLQRARLLLPEGLDWAQSGVLEHRVEGKRGVIHADGLAASGPASAQQLHQAGLAADSPAHWHTQAGWIKPGQLVRAMLAQPGIEWRGGQAARGLRREGAVWLVLGEGDAVLAQAPLVIIAAGFDSLALLANEPTDGEALPSSRSPSSSPLSIPLSPLRGQVAWGAMPANTTGLPPFPVNGHGSLLSGIPSEVGPIWCTGSTFDRTDPTPSIHPQDSLLNLERLRALLPAAAQALAGQFEQNQARAWAGVRCTSPDRLPVVGPIAPPSEGGTAGSPGLWISTAMGARGLSFAVLCGELIAAQLHDEPSPVPPDLAALLAARRFADRLEPVAQKRPASKMPPGSYANKAYKQHD